LFVRRSAARRGRLRPLRNRDEIREAKMKKPTLFLALGASTLAMAESERAFAQEATQADDEIVVSARKTEESLIEAPVAVSVISGDFLEQTGFNSIDEIVRFVPGFDLTPVNTTRATGSKIRGISTFSFSDGFESSVATVIDGVVMGREAQGFFDLFDVQSIEVIKGPQGTLFGKNASAGVVNIKTKLPEMEFGGGADFTYGSFDEVKARASITGPLIEDKLAFRLSGTFNKSDGNIDNAFPGEKDLNNKDSYAARAKLLYQPSDEFRAIFAADIVQEDVDCCVPTFRTAGPNSGAITFAQNPGVQQLQAALAALGVVPSPGNRVSAVRAANINQRSEAGGASLTMEYDADWTNFTSITSWRDWNINEFNEADNISTSNVNNRNGTKSSTEQFSQELRLDGDIGDRIAYVGGLYYFHQDLEALGRVDIELALPFPPAFNVRTIADRTVETNSFAAFSEITLDITDDLSLIAGGRFSHEKLEATYSRIASPIITTRPFGPFFGPNVTGAQKVTDDNLSGRVILRYMWSDDLMTYASWTRGYKGPGIDVAESVNVAAITTPGGLPVLAPEVPNLFEAGVRARMFDNSFTFNLTGFHQNVDDLQAIATNSLGSTINLSIDRVNSIGLELETTWEPTFINGLTLTGTGTFNEVDIVQFGERPDLVDRRFRDTPRFYYSVIGDYNLALVGDWSGFLRGEWTWQSSKNSSLARATFSNIDAYGLLNLRAGVNAPNDRYGFVFSVENVTDKVYAHFILGTSYGVLDGNRTSAQFIGDPRTWKLTLRANF
jgi:iron complex outermembrane receptor protein